MISIDLQHSAHVSAISVKAGGMQQVLLMDQKNASVKLRKTAYFSLAWTFSTLSAFCLWPPSVYSNRMARVVYTRNPYSLRRSWLGSQSECPQGTGIVRHWHCRDVYGFWYMAWVPFYIYFRIHYDYNYSLNNSQIRWEWIKTLGYPRSLTMAPADDVMASLQKQTNQIARSRSFDHGN